MGALSHAEANIVQRAVRRLAAGRPGAWVLARAAHRLDRRVFGLTHGRHTLSSLVSGLPVVMLTTTGARSGRRRTVPVLGVPTVEGVAVIASNFGRTAHPAWCHNLRAHPLATIEVAGRVQAVRAQELDGASRERVLRDGVRLYPGWYRYARRAAGRPFPVFLLAPIDG